VVDAVVFDEQQLSKVSSFTMAEVTAWTNLVHRPV
jgi:hypothetical protein